MKGSLVLVVDDDEDICGVLEAGFKQLGIPSHIVRNAADARAWLAANMPSVILLDVMMPGGNGLDLCRWIRGRPELEKVPVILASGLKDEETAQDALELGAVDFIRKPYSIKALQEKLARYGVNGKAP